MSNAKKTDFSIESPVQLFVKNFFFIYGLIYDFMVKVDYYNNEFTLVYCRSIFMPCISIRYGYTVYFFYSILKINRMGTGR